MALEGIHESEYISFKNFELCLKGFSDIILNKKKDDSIDIFPDFLKLAHIKGVLLRIWYELDDREKKKVDMLPAELKQIFEQIINRGLVLLPCMMRRSSLVKRFLVQKRWYPMR